MNKAASTTRPHVYIGDTLVFKTSSEGLGLVGALKEVSRSLIAISKGFPHAAVFGIHKKEDGYYIVEEKLDIATSNIFFNRAKVIYDKILGESALERQEQVLLKNFLDLFIVFTGKLEAFDLGGDFKLNNLSMRRGDISSIFATDLILGKIGNPYLPMSFKEWKTVADKEGGHVLYLDPFFRLKYYVMQAGGAKNKKIKSTRRKVHHLKRKTRRSQN